MATLAATPDTPKLYKCHHHYSAPMGSVNYKEKELMQTTGLLLLGQQLGQVELAFLISSDVGKSQ